MKAIYHSKDFRTYPPETVQRQDGQDITLMLCEELDPESGRWEPFYTNWPAGHGKFSNPIEKVR